jgi:hypothetical protein
MRARDLAAVFAAVFLAAGCNYKKSDYSPTAPLARKIIVLEQPGTATLPADGFSRLRLAARLVGEPSFDKRSVVFSTSNGTLDGGDAVDNCSGCRKVAADGAGNAFIDLVSSQRVGSAVVKAWPADSPGITASVTLDFVGSQPDGTIKFVAAPSRAPADGSTLSTFSVEISASLPTASRQVTFTATSGKFSPGDLSSIPVDTDAGGRASADLKSPREISTARVTAKVNGVSRETSILFERALPDRITVVADPVQAVAAAATKIHVTATLLRDIGLVTDGTVVKFSAERKNGAPLVGFTNVTASATASGTTTVTASADFIPGLILTAPELITIFVTQEDAKITGSTQVQLTSAPSG